MVPRKRLFENNITDQAEHQALSLGAPSLDGIEQTRRRSVKIILRAICTPYGIRTRVTGVRGRRPRPLDERG